MYIIFSLLITASFAFASGIVNDKKTGLMWQDNPDAKQVKKTWDESLIFCKQLHLADYSDWRLPSVKELKYLVSQDPRDGGIKKGFMYVGDSGYYWSSTPHDDNEAFAWMMNFKRGYEYSNYKTYTRHIRCVRDVLPVR